MPCAEHRAGDRGDGVGVPAKGGGEAQRFGGFIEETRGYGERRGHGFVGLHAGAAVASEDGGEFASDMEPSSLTAHSMNIFTRATTDALADQLPRGGWDSTNANAFERKPRSPAMARLTAAATSVVDSMPCMVLCVTTQERQASSAKAFPGMKAMPTGVARWRLRSWCRIVR